MENKINLLFTAPLDFLPALKTQIEKEVNLIYLDNPSLEQTKLLLKENAIDAWVCNPCPTYTIDADLMDLAGALRIISTPSTGTNHIDLKAAEERNVKVVSLRNSGVVERIYSSSEFTFNLLISVVRKFCKATAVVKAGHWRDVEDTLRGRELNGMSIGIVGYGRIGGNLSRYCHAFGMKISTYDPYKTVQDQWVNQVNDIQDLYANNEVIAICVHLNDETYRMVNRTSFDAMQDGVYFINTSRGDVIDEEALLSALESGKITAAGLDVISDEQNITSKGHPLVEYCKTHENLVITPHIAGLSYDSEFKAQNHSFQTVKQFFEI